MEKNERPVGNRKSRQTDKHPTALPVPKSHLSPHVPCNRGVGKGCPPKSPSLLHQEGVSRDPKGSQHPGAQQEAAWDHCWPLRWRKPAQALDTTEISTPLSSCPFPALSLPVCPLSSPISLTIPSPPPFAAVLGTHRSSSLLLLPSSALPLRAKAFFPAQSQDHISSTSLHLSPNPNPVQRVSAPYLTLSDAQRCEEPRRSEIFHLFLTLNDSSSYLGQHPAKKLQKKGRNISCGTPPPSMGGLLRVKRGLGIPNSRVQVREGKFNPDIMFSCRSFWYQTKMSILTFHPILGGSKHIEALMPMFAGRTCVQSLPCNGVAPSHPKTGASNKAGWTETCSQSQGWKDFPPNFSLQEQIGS